ncbi:hypothetical protein P7K49_023970, partial [Saguinus oedipus]
RQAGERRVFVEAEAVKTKAHSHAGPLREPSQGPCMRVGFLPLPGEAGRVNIRNYCPENCRQRPLETNEAATFNG